MADEDDDDLDLKPADAGVAFRAEMYATNVLLGYWKHLLAALITVLLSVLVYNQYSDWVVRTQRRATAQIAEVTSGLPGAIPELPSLLAMGDPNLSVDDLVSAADELMAIGDESRPPAQVEAWLKAAELYRLAEKTDSQREALEKAAGAADDVLSFSAQGALANLDLATGDAAGAEKRLRSLMDAQSGFLAQQAALDLGSVLEQQDRTADAAALYGEFLEKWPESPLAEEASKRAAAVGGAG